MRTRVRFTFPWWIVISSATALGWILVNAAIFFQHRAIDEDIRQESVCMKESKPIISANGGMTESVNPCGLGDWAEDSYKPLAGLIYGPLYLLCCSLPYWLIFGRRSSPGLTRRIAWLAVAALVIEWAAIVGDCIRPGYLGGMCTNADPYIGPPATISAALIISWVVATQLIQRFTRHA
jgi:hypothetical protein